jgi:hypothetical protein
LCNPDNFSKFNSLKFFSKYKSSTCPHNIQKNQILFDNIFISFIEISLSLISLNISNHKVFNASQAKIPVASEYFFHVVNSHLLNESLSIAGKSS